MSARTPEPVSHETLAAAERGGSKQPVDIVCFGVIDWEFRWQRPQQMMSRLAAEGHRVFFVSPSRFLTISARPYELHPLAERIREVRLRLPQSFHIYGEAIPPDVARAAVDALAALQADQGITHGAAFVEVASWAPLAYAAREAFGWRIVYDCMDDWEHFEGIAPDLLGEERRLVARADVVAVSARALWEKWSPHTRRPVLARNAADFDHFHSPPAEDPLPSVRTPVAGYFGAIASWFDLDLMIRLARENPGVSFVLVGDVFGVPLERLKALPNVQLTGAQPYARMPAYLARFDVCLVPFLLTEATKAMDVVKFYEYASQGKPVVASALPELAPYRDLLYVAGDQDEFVRLFQKALREDDPGLRERRIALARENTWAQRVALIKERLAEAEKEAAGFRIARMSAEEALYRALPDAGEEATGDGVPWEQLSRSLAATLAEREQAVQALSRRLTQAQQIIGEQQEGIDYLKRVRTGLEKAYADLNAEQERLKREVNKAYEGIAAANATLNQVLGSRAWRVAEAYRRGRMGIARIVKRLRHPVPRPAAIAAAAAPGSGATPALPPGPPTVPEGFPALPKGRHDVVVFSIVDWEFRFQRPQQIATQFGRHGHRTFYISITRFLPADGPAWKLTLKAPHVAELLLRARRVPHVYQQRLSGPELAHFEEAVLRLADDLGIGDAVSLVQVPFWTPLALRLREALGWPVVYDCMDEWANFPGMGAAVLAQEDRLFAEADLTAVSADLLHEKALTRSRRVVLARNGIDLEHYRRHYSANQLLGPVQHPVIGYYGALASWVDVPLLEKMARRFPDATIVLAGGRFDVDLSVLEKMPNVRLLGQRPYEEMPPLLWNIDVCVIPFLVNDITHATNPVKFYEYCYGGKPVVAPDLVELRPYADLCYLGGDHDEFLEHVEAALREPPDDPRREKRRQVALENDWSTRYAAIEAGVVDAFPLVSVVVVTYGALELTKECLRSLFEDETWPRLEVIVVDNASPDGTADWLRERAREEPRLAVIGNEENRGFAAANNAGIAASHGEVVVLVNNDTVVPPGLIGRLVDHLRRDASLGLLCPTTNFCGNEARVENDYGSDLTGLAAYAARRAHEQRGAVMDLSVAAMYCVAARREVLDKVGPLDEAFGMGLFEDDDFSMRMRQAGYRVACAEDAYVHHVGQGSFHKLSREEYDALWQRNQEYFQKKWGIEWRPHQTREGVAAPVSKVPAQSGG